MEERTIQFATTVGFKDQDPKVQIILRKLWVFQFQSKAVCTKESEIWRKIKRERLLKRLLKSSDNTSEMNSNF